PHAVPLSAAAVDVLTAMQARRENDYVFPGDRQRKPISPKGILNAMVRALDGSEATIHGWRSTFRDWAAEKTNFPREVAAMALAHSSSSAVEAAYRRGDLFEKRRRLMDAWSQFCATGNGNGAKVVSMR